MRNIFTFFFAMFAVVAFSQVQREPKNVPIHPDMLKKSFGQFEGNQQKTRVCVDTLRYPQMKEQLINSPTQFHIFDLWASDAEQMSQTFLLSGSTITITGVEFFGRRAPTSSANLVVQVSIFNVNANYIPTTSIVSQNITLTDTNFQYRQVTFTTPATVSNNFAVVLRPTSTNGILDFYVNNAPPGQIHDENLSRIKSNYFTGSAGNWVSIPVATSSTTQFPNGPYDFEMLVAPRVSYTITTNFTATPNPVCMQSPVAFTNTSTPAPILAHRMYNYCVFMSYFKGVPDSTFVYLPQPSASLIWSANTNYTYPSGGVFTARLYSLGGLWANCIDSVLKTITVHNLPNVVFNLSTPLVCENAAPFTLTGGTPAGGTYSGPGVNAGVFYPQVAGLGTHSITYTYTDANGCTASSVQQITVDACTQISSPDQTEMFKIFPNPTSEHLNVYYKNTIIGSALLQIMTLDGRLVYQNHIIDSEPLYINVDDWAKGMYLISVSNQNCAPIQTKFVIF